MLRTFACSVLETGILSLFKSLLRTKKGGWCSARPWWKPYVDQRLSHLIRETAELDRKSNMAVRSIPSGLLIMGSKCVVRA
jgi:hypothetical protein